MQKLYFVLEKILIDENKNININIYILIRISTKIIKFEL